MGLNGGPVFKLSEAISLVVHCDTQDEIDHYWFKLDRYDEARKDFERAASMTRNARERALLLRRAEESFERAAPSC
jgi:hypothetical protein